MKIAVLGGGGAMGGMLAVISPAPAKGHPDRRVERRRRGDQREGPQRRDQGWFGGDHSGRLR